jgi:transposase
MSAKLYSVTLTDADRTSLQQMLRAGTHNARQLTRARILLLADQGRSDAEISAALGTSLSTVHRVRQQYVGHGLQPALSEKPRPGVAPLLDAAAEARLTALACSDAPEGYARWTLRLLADRMVELEIVESISYKTVGEYLKKAI